MEKHIRESLTDDLLELAGKFYNVKLEELQYHGGFENFIYVFKKDNTEYILRLVHSDHRIYQHVIAEIEFIDYLAHHGACVSTVVKSVNDKIVEKIKINKTEYFTVTVFVRGLGDRISESLEKPKFWEDLGEQIGLLHKLTKTFNPKHKRSIWYDDTLYQLAPKVLEDELGILEKLNQRIEEIKSFEKTEDNYGLIHTDLHIGNMVIDKLGKLTFFDFDDSAYKHFISDLAIVIFYNMSFQNLSIENKTDKSIWILNNFFKGYNRNNSLPREELKHLNDFLKLRELILYTVIKAGGEETVNSNWGSRFLNIYRDKILNDEPFIDMKKIMAKVDC